jgi:hypothetical protein
VETFKLLSVTLVINRFDKVRAEETYLTGHDIFDSNLSNDLAMPKEVKSLTIKSKTTHGDIPLCYIR